MIDPTCAACPSPRYCAPLRCYCAHAECPAVYRAMPPIPETVVAKKDAAPSTWDQRDGETWIDQL